MKTHTHDYAALFMEHGLRATRQRTAIYESLLNTTSHPSADEIYNRVIDQCPGMSRATVYNNLDALTDAGLIQMLPPANGSGCARYDATTDNHIHLRDADTGKLRDVPDDLSQKVLKHLPDEIIQELEMKLGFKVDRVNLEFIGKPA